MSKRIAGLCVAILWLGTLPGLAQQQPAAPPATTAPATPPPAAVAPAATPTAAPSATPSPRQTMLPREVLDPIERISKSIETAEKALQQLKEIETDLQRVRSNVEQIIYDSTANAEQLRPQLADVKGQIEKLGPAPTGSQPAESPAVASERTKLNQMAGELDSAIKTAELAWVKAKQLIDRITVIRYQAFARNLFERRQSPVLPALWADVAERFPTVVARSQYYSNDWSGWIGTKSGTLFPLLAMIALVGAGLWWVLTGFIAARRAIVVPIPNFFDRIASAAWVAPMRLLVPAVAALLVYLSFDSLELLFSPWERPADALIKGALILIATSALARAILAPGEPAWRIIPVADQTARRLYWCVLAFVAIYMIDTVLNEFGRAIYVPLNITVGQTFISNVAFAGVLVVLLLTPFVPQTGPLRAVNGVDKLDLANIKRHKPYWLKLPLWLLAIGIVVTSSLGYVALGRFMAHQIVLSGSVLVLSGLLYLSIRAITRERMGQISRVGGWLERHFGVERQRQGQFARLVELTLNFILLLTAVPLLLLQWGFAGPDIRDWMKNALFGFEVGGFKISLARILFGIALFTVLLFLTRLMQRMLRQRVQTQSTIDSGIANSVDQAIGYGGIMLAALISVSFAGFDVTNLAIVAGALSVGIGFGLQSIVNNFVSGLILLIERPIKVGDWIVVGDQQGHVRRISVRATEIETFDRASIILPNSELISGRVFNWTHRNQLGRAMVKFSVDPTADPERMIAMLLDIARNHPLVERNPEPAAGLDYFGTDRLEFTLITTLKDVGQGGHVKSDLRLAILRGCRQLGVIATMVGPQTPTQPALSIAPATAPATGIVPPIPPIALPQRMPAAAGGT